jgi:DNA-binding transcriptional MerR regulator
MYHYKIRSVSKLTNVPIDTIRNWEKRYDFLKPEIGKNGERLYTDRDVELIRKAVNLLKTGNRISEIASKLLDEGITSLDGARVSNEFMLMIDEYYNNLISADLLKLDQIEALIEITIVFKNRIDYVYMPLLERIRFESVKKMISTGQERFACGHLLNKMKSFLSTALYRPTQNRLPVICASVSDNNFEGGLLALACGLKLAGYNVYNLGANVPVDEIFTFSKNLQPCVIAISIYSPDDLIPIVNKYKDFPMPVCIGGMGVRVSEINESVIGNIHLISYTGSTALDKIESISSGFQF